MAETDAPKIGEPGWADRTVDDVRAQTAAREQAKRMAEAKKLGSTAEGPTVPEWRPDPEQEKAQLALFPSPEQDPASPRALPAVVEKRGAGRPPGAMNVATKEWQEYLLANHTSPLIGEARTSMMTPMDLARALGCTLLEAFDRIHRSRAFIARYMHQEMPKAIDIGGAGGITLVIGTIAEGAAAQGDAGALQIEGTLVDDTKKEKQ